MPIDELEFRVPACEFSVSTEFYSSLYNACKRAGMLILNSDQLSRLEDAQVVGTKVLEQEDKSFYNVMF